MIIQVHGWHYFIELNEINPLDTCQRSKTDWRSTSTSFSLALFIPILSCTKDTVNFLPSLKLNTRYFLHLYNLCGKPLSSSHKKKEKRKKGQSCRRFSLIWATPHFLSLSTSVQCQVTTTTGWHSFCLENNSHSISFRSTGIPQAGNAAEHKKAGKLISPLCKS